MRISLSFIIRASVVGNAVLLVLLVGGSHYAGNLDVISPHKPVHLRADLSIRLDDPEVLGDPIFDRIDDAQAAWDDAVKAGGPGGVPDIINNQAGGGAGIFDAIVIDVDPGETQGVTFWSHTGTQGSVVIAGEPCTINDPQNCWLAEAREFTAAETGVGQGAIVVILNTSIFVTFLSPGDAWRTITHEFGHVLALGDHDTAANPGAYDYMMDSFPDSYPGDYKIANVNSGLFPNLQKIDWFADEASCARETFAIPGKQLCE